ncbi:MAG: hypothetical protein ACYTHN_21070, partial [Planctomycetota bacterium]
MYNHDMHRAALIPRILLLLSLGFPIPASGGDPSFTFVYLPSSDLSNMIEDVWPRLIQGKHPAEFYRICRAALDGNDKGMVYSEDGRFLQVPLFVRTQIGRLRGEGLSVWRMYAGPEGRGALRALPKPPTAAALGEVVQRFPNTRAGGEACLRQSDLLLEAGRFQEALETLEWTVRWQLSDPFKKRLGDRLAFVRTRLTLSPSPNARGGRSENAEDARKLSAAFSRPVKHMSWPGPAGKGSQILDVIGNDRYLIIVESRRLVTIPLGSGGLPRGQCSVMNFASTLIHAHSVGRIVYLTTLPTASPWRAPSGKRQKPTNRIFAVDPIRRTILWVANPVLTTPPANLPGIFVSGARRWGDEVVAAVSRRTPGKYLESFLLRLDPATGKPRGETFLFVRTLRIRKLSFPRFTWALHGREDRLFACDGLGAILCLERDSVRWIRPYSVSSRVGANSAWRRNLRMAQGRLIAAPRGTSRVLTVRARDGILLSSQRFPRPVHLMKGKGPTLWIVGQDQIARMDGGDPRSVEATLRKIPGSLAKSGIPFESLFIVPYPRRLLLIGSSKSFQRNLVVSSPPVTFRLLNGLLYRIARKAVTVFRIPKRPADMAIGVLP